MTTKRTDKFQQIADELRAHIDSGAVGAGDRLPTEHDLAAEHGTTRTTVRAALKVLIEEGVVEKRGLPPTAGYFVREIVPRTWVLADEEGFIDPWRHLLSECESARTREVTRMRVDHGYDRVRADARADTLAHLLHLDENDLVACRSSVRYLDGDPVDLTDVYAPYERVKDGPFMSGGDLDVYALFADTGRPQRFRDQLIARRNPLPSEQARLELPDATGVMELLRSLYFAGDDAPGLLVHSVYSAAGADFVSSRT